MVKMASQTTNDVHQLKVGRESIFFRQPENKHLQRADITDHDVGILTGGETQLKITWNDGSHDIFKCRYYSPDNRKKKCIAPFEEFVKALTR